MPYDPLTIQPGTMRSRISIQGPSALTDSFGQPQRSWTTILTTWAEIRTLSLREAAQTGGTLVSNVTHVITIRHPGSSVRLVSGQKVIDSSFNVYNVQAVDDVMMRHIVVRLQCEVVNSAV